MNSPNAAANLASVVFLKIQEFARRPAQEQARMRAQLETVVAVTTAELAHAGWIALDAADGIAIAVLADPEGALRLAQRSLTAAVAGLPLSVGVNHGAVQVTSGSRGPDGMTGDGIAVAASVAEFAATTRVLISRSFREALAEAAPALDAGLSPAGVYTDAGLRTHELFYPDKGAAGRRRRRLFAAGVAAAAVLVGAGIGARAATGGHQKVLEGTLGKVGMSAKQRETWIRGLRERIKF
jgi:class 3 adenylate cyclase